MLIIDPLWLNNGDFCFSEAYAARDSGQISFTSKSLSPFSVNEEELPFTHEQLEPIVTCWRESQISHVSGIFDLIA